MCVCVCVIYIQVNLCYNYERSISFNVYQLYNFQSIHVQVSNSLSWKEEPLRQLMT